MNRCAVPIRAAVCAALLALSGAAEAQDPQFSQSFAAPQYLNPALTGNTDRHRVVLNHRVQWPGVQPGWTTSAFGYDHRLAGTRSGLGLHVLHDKAGRHGLYHTTVAGAYAHGIRLDRRKFLRFGLRLGWAMRGVDASGFLFADQIVREGAARTIETGLIERITYMDMAAGAVYHTDRYWAGVSVGHLNRPDQSLFLHQEARLAMRTSVHGGYRFPLDGQHPDRSETRMTLAMHYKAQAKWDQLDIGGYIDHKRVAAGLWYRGLPVKPYAPGHGNSEAVIVMVVFETESRLRIAYSYDITISRRTMESGGAHELSLAYEWPQRTKGRRHAIVPCPKF